MREYTYEEFIKSMECSMADLKKMITATDEELEIARKILSARAKGYYVDSFIAIDTKYDFELWQVKKQQIISFIGHSDEIYDIIMYLRSEYFIKAAKEIVKFDGDEGATYTVYSSRSGEVLSDELYSCADVYLCISFDDGAEEYYYRINPSSVFFMNYQVKKEENGGFNDNYREESADINIKSIRDMTGLSQVKFAEKYGIPRRNIENWESCKSFPPAYLVKLLDRAVREDFRRL